MTDLVIYGVGPFARLMHFYFTHDSDYRVSAFTADREYLTEKAFCGLPAIPFEEVAGEYAPGRTRMFVAIGYRRMRDRRLMFQRAKDLGYVLANYVSSHAVRFPGLEMGENNVAMANVVFEPFVKIGDNNVFWSGTLVCHDVIVGDGNYIAANCVVAGNSVIRDSCFLGNGVVLINDLDIASETHALPGSVLLNDTREYGRYMGNPAREIGSHRERGIEIARG